MLKAYVPPGWPRSRMITSILKRLRSRIVVDCFPPSSSNFALGPVVATTFSQAAHDSGLRQPSESDLIRWLKSVLQLSGEGKVYIIVDALDECPNTSGFPKTARDKVLDLFEDFVDWDIPDLRICVTSRPESDMQIVIEPFASRHNSVHDESGQKKVIRAGRCPRREAILTCCVYRREA